MDLISLSNGVSIPKAILGSFNVTDQYIINDMVKTSISEGIIGFDTSPSYGSEGILGNALINAGIPREKVFISDKIDAWQMYEGNGSIKKYVEKSMKDLTRALFLTSNMYINIASIISK